ncbi:chitin deacetylase [Pseudohyphozyma bogoriensis]|nr:chitin deacetylase [Pseudohyphozyma bogoriensis]
MHLPPSFGPVAAVLLLHSLVAVHAQEGAPPGGALSSPSAAGYSCDTSACKLPSCACASVNPPGGLQPSEVPQFVTVTADDAVQSYTIEVLNHLLGSRKNPNGCPPKQTYFNSLTYTNYSLVTDWYVAGNEIADHTMTHVGSPPASEILGNLQALNAFSGIPFSEIKGFRAPLLNLTADTFRILANNSFLYDSSLTAASPANASETDAFWPYTLDYGLANNCIGGTLDGQCQGVLKVPGLWEIPLYATFETVNSNTPIHLMDVQLDATNASTVLPWLKNTFLSHYEGNRQPFGLYLHPIHLAINYPGLVDPDEMRALYVEFLDWVQTMPDVWIVSNSQMLEWLKAPVPISQLSNFTALGCSTPQVDPTLKICNGIEVNEVGLLTNCPFADFPWTTCFGCPVTEPSPGNPVPAQNTSIGGVRYRLPSNCSTPFWDPIAGKCICTSATCAFQDDTGPIVEPSSTNSSATGSSSSASPTSTNGTSSGVRQVVMQGVVGLVAIVGAVILVAW